MRPMLNPGLRRVWRSPATVQLGVYTKSRVLLQDVDDAFADLLASLDGGSDLATVVDRAVTSGHEEAAVRRLLDELLAAGAVIDASTWPGGVQLNHAARARLAPDLAAAVLGGADEDTPVEHTAALAATTVVVQGVSRLGAVIATVASAAGFGRIEVMDERTVQPPDLCPGGFTPADLGVQRSTLLRRRPHWAATAGAPATSQTLHVLTDVSPTRALAAQLTRSGKPHLVVGSSEGVGRIGPLVVPGSTPCLRCHDLTRTDRDPQWARVALQLDDDAGLIADDSALTMATAALATLHLTSWARGGQPPSLNGVLTLRPPHGEAAHQAFPFHPSCGCTWPTNTQQDTMAS
jgi:bacteriocin biosynthesis cyclodehydratase domain-containing protein